MKFSWAIGNKQCVVGRMGKRGFIFPPYITILTLLMCITVVMLYLNQQGVVQSSLVSPLPVLDVRDKLEIFEMRERELILESLKKDDFRSSFLGGLRRDMKDFLLDDLFLNGVAMERGSFDEDSFFENVVYPNIGDSDVFVRSKIGKMVILSASNVTETNFPVVFLFEFERKYSINEEGSGFSLEVVE